MTAIPILLLLAVCPARTPDCRQPDVWEVPAEIPGGCASPLWLQQAAAVVGRFEDEKPWDVVVGVRGCHDGRPA